MEQGYLSIVLHAHLPFVHHPESETYLEERWLFEALTETYIPLLQVYNGLMRDGVDFRITMSITPPLLAMLGDRLLQDRYTAYLSRLIELAEKEVIRTEESPEFYPLACNYLERFRAIQSFYEENDRDMIRAFRTVQDAGHLEIITCAATHAFLPLVYTEESIRAQIATAVHHHQLHLGKAPKGIWLPECGYAPKLDTILQEYGLEFCYVDSHGLLTANPSPKDGTLSPIVTPHGLAVFARDGESSKQVWSSEEGYPGDFDYREYYRDIGYDLDFDIVKPYIHPEGIRVNTGMKYFRITGKGEYKEPYDFDQARSKAALHAGNFLFNREKQVEYFAPQMNRKPIVVAPYDAELFGHWWFEGPVFLDMLFRKMHYDQQTIKPITPSEYLGLYEDYQVCRMSMSSWGRHGYADVWLRGENDWIYPALHRAEHSMVELANEFRELDSTIDPVPASSLRRRALNQAARELMLAQSSDWAFIMDSKTMVDYAVKRTKYHINRFLRLTDMVRQGAIDEAWLSQVEQIDNIFPDMDYAVYESRYPVVRYDRSPSLTKTRVLMLSWEFPPMTVGGLSRHVYDLSRYLARQGVEVHVVTTHVGAYPAHEIIEGVHVHRVHVMQPDGGEFIHFAFQMNLMMIDACKALVKSGLTFHLVHAHDWLVSYSAQTLKQLYGFPILATIHATEHGRNHGIHSDLQRYIHHQEWMLTYEAWRVIVCSTYMKHEVIDVFQLPADKVDVLPNGVDPELLQPHAATSLTKEGYAEPHEQIVMFIGRLVREKGVHTLLESAHYILSECPDAKFLIVGRGPEEAELRAKVAALGLGHKVHFTGFVSDEQRNHLLHIADVTVFPSLYEPFGIVALEAMAAGTPVVVADVGGLGDVVNHARNGLKMYPGDAWSLATQVKDVLKNPDWARQLADTARDEIDRYDWNRIARDTVQVYERVLNEQAITASSSESMVI